MNILIINASPKKRGGASRYFSRVLRLFLPGKSVRVEDLRGRGDFKRVLAAMADCDAAALSLPLYVDAPPSHVLAFLREAEAPLQAAGRRPRLYALCNNGFIEGRQNRPCMGVLRCFCGRVGLAWGGGVGIGGGVMLHVLSIVYPIVVAVQMAMSLLTGGVGEALLPILANLLTWLFLESGALFNLAALARDLRAERPARERYTRVMLPSFVFIPIADAFMFLSSLFRGRLLFALLGRDRGK